jgi:hypothetical protein
MDIQKKFDEIDKEIKINASKIAEIESKLINPTILSADVVNKYEIKVQTLLEKDLSLQKQLASCFEMLNKGKYLHLLLFLFFKSTLYKFLLFFYIYIVFFFVKY